MVLTELRVSPGPKLSSRDNKYLFVFTYSEWTKNRRKGGGFQHNSSGRSQGGGNIGK